MTKTTIFWIVAWIANVPIFVGLGKWVFKDWDGLGETIYYMFKPNEWAMARGESGADSWARVKGWFFVFACAAIVFVEYRLRQELIP